MRRIITWVATSLDGYMEGPNGEGDLGWLMPFVEESLPDNSEMLANEIDTILLGRITYQGFSEYWPSQEGEFADLMNVPPKLVFASPGSLESVSWGAYDNARLVDDDVEETLRELKSQDGKDMVVLASGGLVSSLLGAGLIDELRITVCPVVLGAGKTSFRNIRAQVGLELVDVKPYTNGSARLTYRV
jgi:dihydrofolate reductase